MQKIADLIYRDKLLSAYDAAHKGPPGGARKLIAEAPAVDAVKEAEKDGWICEKKACGSKKLDIKCMCGKNVYLDAMVFPDNTFTNRIYCTNCGLSMRSPQTDKYAEWLINYWTKNVQRDGDGNG